MRVRRLDEGEDFKLRAGVMQFGGRATLVVSDGLLAAADRGGEQANFTLAHEVGHLALHYREERGTTRNFRLFKTERGNSNLPPTDVELEANFAAVIFQCGPAILDDRWESNELARRAYTDRRYVTRLRRLFATPEFQAAYGAVQKTPRREVL